MAPLRRSRLRSLATTREVSPGEDSSWGRVMDTEVRRWTALLLATSLMGMVVVRPVRAQNCDSDCNGNGVPDDLDIESGSSADCNLNGYPDECELAGADCNGNGILDACDVAFGGSPDCDHDGLPDECATAPWPRFPFQQSYSIEDPEVCRIVDFDGDGGLDLLVQGQQGLFAIFDRHHGTSAVPSSVQRVDAFRGPFATGQLDGDGRLDVVIAHSVLRCSNEVWVMRQVERAFERIHSFTVATPVQDLLVADLDSDGFEDLAVAERNGIQIHLGLGDGTFTDGPVVDYRGPMTAGDLDGDGDLDLVSGGQVQRNDGPDGWTPGARTQFIIGRAVLADLDFDGAVDLLSPAGQIFWAERDGFTAERLHPIPSGRRGRGSIAGDIDGDGFDDILFADTEGVTPYVNAGGRQLLRKPTLTFAGDLRCFAGRADNLDGHADIVIGDRGQDRITVLRGLGRPTEFGRSVLEAQSDLPFSAAIEAQDFDGDGDEDILVGAGINLRVYENRGGRFVVAWEIRFGVLPQQFEIVDLDRDGLHDFVVIDGWRGDGSRSPKSLRSWRSATPLMSSRMTLPVARLPHRSNRRLTMS